MGLLEDPFLTKKPRGLLPELATTDPLGEKREIDAIRAAPGAGIGASAPEDLKIDRGLGSALKTGGWRVQPGDMNFGMGDPGFELPPSKRRMTGMDFGREDLKAPPSGLLASGPPQRPFGLGEMELAMPRPPPRPSGLGETQVAGPGAPPSLPTPTASSMPLPPPRPGVEMPMPPPRPVGIGAPLPPPRPAGLGAPPAGLLNNQPLVSPPATMQPPAPITPPPLPPSPPITPPPPPMTAPTQMAGAMGGAGGMAGGLGGLGSALGGIAKALGGGGGKTPPPEAKPPQLDPSRAGPETSQHEAQSRAAIQPLMQGLLKHQDLVDPRRKGLI
jgi:hypothetical protein